MSTWCLAGQRCPLHSPNLVRQVPAYVRQMVIYSPLASIVLAHTASPFTRASRFQVSDIGGFVHADGTCYRKCQTHTSSRHREKSNLTTDAHSKQAFGRWCQQLCVALVNSPSPYPACSRFRGLAGSHRVLFALTHVRPSSISQGTPKLRAGSQDAQSVRNARLRVKMVLSTTVTCVSMLQEIAFSHAQASQISSQTGRPGEA